MRHRSRCISSYIEAIDDFIAEDVRDIVDRQWPHGSFYPSVPPSQGTATLRVSKAKRLDSDRLFGMLSHRSMRIDGPGFRGRPLGHRFDPLRSQIAPCPPALLSRIATELLDAHDFRESDAIVLSPHLVVRIGRLYQTLEWQSPAFAEYGVGADDDFRDDPIIDSIHGRVALLIDSSPNRDNLSGDERNALASLLGDCDATVAVLYNGKELSSTGGLWRSTLRDVCAEESFRRFRVMGLESITSLLLVATLIYLEVAPELTWDHVNYLD
jgi:hypothetical protein